MIDFFEEHFGVVIFCALAALIGLAVFSAFCEAKTYEKFMSECKTDHKEYECYAMWRAGMSHNRSGYVYVAPVIR